MSVREVFDNPGSFELQLLPDTPPDTLKAITELDHLVVHAQGNETTGPAGYTDATLLSEARYAGPILEIDFEDEPFTLRGAGMIWHLGDSLGNGPFMAADGGREFTSVNLDGVIKDYSNGGIIPASLTQGTITNTASTQSIGTIPEGEIALTSFRVVMKAFDAHYRVNPDGTVDAGPTSSNEVYLVNEDDGGRLAVAIRSLTGSDPERTGLETVRTRSRRDATRWVSRVAIVDTDYSGATEIVDFTDRSSNPYFDIRNNALVRNRIVTRPASDTISVTTYFDTELDQNDLEESIDVDIEQWEIADGKIEVGDFMWVYDPEAGISDAANEIFFRGQWIYPQRIRILEADWPFTKGMGVYVRPGGSAVTAADWIDLTPYVVWERIP